MSYEMAFAAVPDCQVVWAEYFGSYQGRFLAKIVYKGETLYLHDWYGSCSGCDSFEAEFGWDDDSKPDYQERLAAFGLPYVESALPLNNILTALRAEASDWDEEIKEMIAKLEAETAPENISAQRVVNPETL
jgi:hypothetical protein